MIFRMSTWLVDRFASQIGVTSPWIPVHQAKMSNNAWAILQFHVETAFVWPTRGSWSMLRLDDHGGAEIMTLVIIFNILHTTGGWWHAASWQIVLACWAAVTLRTWCWWWCCMCQIGKWVWGWVGWITWRVDVCECACVLGQQGRLSVAGGRLTCAIPTELRRRNDLTVCRLHSYRVHCNTVKWPRSWKKLAISHEVRSAFGFHEGEDLVKSNEKHASSDIIVLSTGMVSYIYTMCLYYTDNVIPTV